MYSFYLKAFLLVKQDILDCVTFFFSFKSSFFIHLNHFLFFFVKILLILGGGFELLLLAQVFSDQL